MYINQLLIMKRIVYLLFACALLYACKSDDPTFCTCKITETQVTSLVYNEAKIHYMIEHPSLNGNGDSYKSPSIAKYGVYYSATNNNPTSNDQVVLYDHSGDYSMSEEVTITGLKEKTHYYVRGVLRDALGSQILGDVIEFTTPRIPDDKVTMNFTGITEITKTTANFQ